MTIGADATLRLDDGRVLGWATYGDPEGTPVVALHGSPDSRVIWRLADRAAALLQVRIVAPDRPGFGLSDAKPGRTILDWVDDLDALAEHLDIDRFPILCISGGSPYATASAWCHPDRVTRLGLFSVISPLDAPGVTKGASRMVRFAFLAARRAPFLLEPFARTMVRTVRRNPSKAARRLIATRPPADRAIIERPEVMAVLMDNLANQFKDAPSIALEMRAAARYWGFPLTEIETPTVIWQGGVDDVHTPAMARYLHDALPNCELVFEPEYATFDFIERFDEILTRLTA